MTAATPVQTLDKLQAELYGLWASGMHWRQIRADFYPSVPAGTLCSVAHGRQPRKAAIRAALGLPAHIDQDGAIILAEARECACGCRETFVPRTVNQKRLAGHPRRRNR